MDKIKVIIKSNSPNRDFGSYRYGDSGDLVCFSNCMAIVLKEDGKFVKVKLTEIEVMKEEATTIPGLTESEDEKNLNRAIWYIENPASNVIKDTMLVEWLKARFKYLKQQEHREGQLIQKAVDWFRKNWRDYINTDKDGVVCFGFWEYDFRKAMNDRQDDWFRKNGMDYINTDKDGGVCFGHWESDFRKAMNDRQDNSSTTCNLGHE